jgi:hypothetical protein
MLEINYPSIRVFMKNVKKDLKNLIPTLVQAPSRSHGRLSLKKQPFIQEAILDFNKILKVLYLKPSAQIILIWLKKREFP